MGQPWGCTPGVRSEIGDRLPCAAKALAFALNQSMLVLVGEAEGGQCWRATRQGIADRKLIRSMSEGVVSSDHALIEWIDFSMPKKTH